MAFSLSSHVCILDPGAVPGAEDGAWIKESFTQGFGERTTKSFYRFRTMHKIILIGGNSSAGKTTLARLLGKRFDLTCVHLDDYTHEINDPDLAFHSGEAGFWDQPAQDLFERLVRVADKTGPYLEALASNWISAGKSGLIEGEKIHPRCMQRMLSLELVTGLFLIEADRQHLYEILYQRSERFRALSEAGRWKVVEVNQCFGSWLMQEAQQRSLPWEYARPWETLVSRVIDQLQ